MLSSLAKPFAPLLVSALALVPGPIVAHSSPTKVASRPETPTLSSSAAQINVAEAAAGAYNRQLERFYKRILEHNKAVWYTGARNAQYKAYLDAVIANERAAKAAEAARRAAYQEAHTVSSSIVTTPVPGPTNFGDLSSVVQCIKDHESGNYSESSHPSSGSGAYQFIPGTWQTWSARAGYGGWSYAYQAPPSVQDAVLAYTLTHGGAGNWSNRWGDDPCTAGLPGGG